MAVGNEGVRFDINIEAEAAVKTLRALLDTVDTVDAKVILFGKTLTQMATQAGVSWRSLLQTFKAINTELSAQHKPTIFGNVGGQPVFDMTEQYLSAAEAAGRMGAAGTQAADNIDKGLKKASTSGKAFQHILNTIRGTLVAIGVFQAIQFVTEGIRKAIETAKEFETSLYRITNVEKILSQAGVETSVQGLLDVVQNLKKQLPIFSEADLMQQVSLIGIMTKEFGLTEKQIQDVAAAVGVLNIRSGESEDLLATTNKVLTAMVAPSGRGIASLGLDFSEAAIQAMALKTNVLQAGQAFSELTDHQKDMLKIAILLESTGEELKTVQEFVETNTGALAMQEAQWEDTLRTAGQAFLALRAAAAPFTTGVLKFYETAINGGKALIVIFQAIANSLTVLGGVLQSALTNPLQFIQDPSKFEAAGEAISKAFSEGMRSGFSKFFSDIIPEDAPEWMHTLFGGFAEQADTATGKVNTLTDAVNKLGEATEGANLDDLLNDLERFNQQIQELERDYQQKLERMEADHLTDLQRMREDYNRSVADTMQDYNDKRADAEARYRLQELEAEARYQERLRQLREKFLYNLEDALRERDARQVLRLIREYQMEKTAAENEEKIRAAAAARQHAEEMARLKREMEQRLQQLAEEFRIKQQRAEEDYQTKKAIEQQEHIDDMDDLRARIQERLDLFAEKLAEELGLRGQAAEDLKNLINEYYGPGGAYDMLYQYSAESLKASTALLLAELQAMYAQAAAMIPTGSPNLDDWWNDPIGGLGSANRNIGNRGRGGTFFANTPTKATFGDRGGEIAQFIPIKESTKPVQLPVIGGSGSGGTALVRIQLSPGLEADIVDKSLEGVSVVLEQVRRDR